MEDYKIIYICVSNGRYMTLDRLSYLLNLNEDYEIILNKTHICGSDIDDLKFKQKDCSIEKIRLQKILNSNKFEKHIIFNPKLNVCNYSRNYCEKLLKLEAKYGVRYDIDVYETHCKELY